MVAQRNEQVEEKLGPAVIHLQLHGAAAFERAAAADNKSEIVCPQLRICVGGVGIGIPGRREDRAGLDSRLYVMLGARIVGSDGGR